MPRSLPRRSRLGLARREAGIVGELERLVERRLVVADVVHQRHRRLVREGVLGDEVLAAELGRVHAHLARRLVHQRLEQERGLGPAGAAIGVHRHGVGVVGLHVAVDRRGLVLAGEQRGVEVGRDRGGEGRHVGADVGLGVDPQRQDVAVRRRVASSAWLTWSRPCASVRNASLRSEVHFTGRPPTFFDAQVTTHSSL